MTLEERFWSKVGPKTDSGCMEWGGCLHRLGYGTFRVNRKKLESSHRMAFFLSKGFMPENHVLHSCDNRKCCNPEHLVEGTHVENMKQCSDRMRNRTSRVGNGFDKLGDSGRSAIKDLYLNGMTNKSALSRMFRVSPSRIRQVING